MKAYNRRVDTIFSEESPGTAPRPATAFGAGQSPAADGFTLIELLVVIAILGLLMTLLIPSLSSAVNIARRTGCQSNLRQIGAGLILYAADHEGSFPRDWRSLTGTRMTNSAVGEVLRNDYFGYPAGEVFDIAICPGMTHKASVQALRTRAQMRSFSTYYRIVAGWGDQLGRANFWAGWRPTASNPSQSDASPLPTTGMINSTPIPQPAARQPLAGEPFTGGHLVRIDGVGNVGFGGQTVMQSHLDGVNTLFADGSVRWSSGRQVDDFNYKMHLFNQFYHMYW